MQITDVRFLPLAGRSHIHRQTRAAVELYHPKQDLWPQISTSA